MPTNRQRARARPMVKLMLSVCYKAVLTRELRLILPAVLLLSGPAFAQQQSDLHQQTTTPPNARFEILQSELAARWTFRLDRFTGRVAQLVKAGDDKNAWEEMEVIGLPALSQASRPRFQLFTSGIAARYTFLIDNDTGKTWVVVTDKRTRSDGSEYEITMWEPFPD